MTTDVVEGKPASFHLPVAFEDGTPMAIPTLVVETPAHGRLEHLVGREYRYSPAPGFVGPDRLTWKAKDAVHESDVATVQIRVVPDTTPPVLTGAATTGYADELVLTFDEPLEAASATQARHYAIDKGISVGTATLAGDRRTVTLTTSELTEGQTYTVSVAGVRDRARQPNAVPAGTSVKILHTLAGYVLREVWTGVSGVEISDLTSYAKFPAAPAIVDKLTQFHAPVNWGDEYGTRIRGYLRPTETAEYTFWIASDDASELWLSPDDQPRNKTKIAHVPGWTREKQWTKFPAQKSEPVRLEAGRRYYIEALQKEQGGGDSLSVAWQKGDSRRQVVPGKCLLLPDRNR
jgi:hypothetical protein